MYGVGSMCVGGEGEVVNIKTQSSQAGLRDFKSLRTHLPHRSSRCLLGGGLALKKMFISLSGYTLEFLFPGEHSWNAKAMLPPHPAPHLALPLGPCSCSSSRPPSPSSGLGSTVVSGKQGPNHGSFLEKTARRKTTVK